METTTLNNVMYMCIGSFITIVVGLVSYFLWQQLFYTSSKKNSIKEKEESEKQHIKMQQEKEKREVEITKEKEEKEREEQMREEQEGMEQEQENAETPEPEHPRNSSTESQQCVGPILLNEELVESNMNNRNGDNGNGINRGKLKTFSDKLSSLDAKHTTEVKTTENISGLLAPLTGLSLLDSSAMGNVLRKELQEPENVTRPLVPESSKVVQETESVIRPSRPESSQVLQETGNVARPLTPELSKKETTETNSETFKTTSATEPTIITFGKKGCKFLSDYAKLLIPEDAVEKSTQITITPLYNYQIDLDEKMLMTPVIKFQSPNELKFLKDIHVQLYTPYSAAENGQPVNVEIMRKPHGEDTYELIGEVKLDQECWIPFWTMQMCSVFAVSPESDVPRTKKRYYSAALARETAQQCHRVMSWMICEDMPNIREINKEYFEAHDNRKVIDAESLEVRYEYDLRLRLQSEGKVLRPGENENPEFQVQIRNSEATIRLHQNYGIGFDGKSVMNISINEESSFMLGLKYQVDAVGVDARFPEISKVNKSCTLDWSDMQRPRTSITASGPRSVGISYNITQLPSTVSRQVTSGYVTRGDVRSAEESVGLWDHTIPSTSGIQPRPSTIGNETPAAVQDERSSSQQHPTEDVGQVEENDAPDSETQVEAEENNNSSETSTKRTQ